jgi:hypothetical protein
VAKQATAMRTRRGRRAVAPIEAERGSESSSDLTAAEGIVVYCSGGGVGNSRRGCEGVLVPAGVREEDPHDRSSGDLVQSCRSMELGSSSFFHPRNK